MSIPFPTAIRFVFDPTFRRWLVCWLACWMPVLLMGCNASPGPDAEVETPPLETIEADVLTLDFTTWPRLVRSQGSLFADEQTVVGTKVAGRVSEVHVDLGDLVATGDPLVTLDQDEFELHATHAEAQLQQARAAIGLGDGDTVEKLMPKHAPPVREQEALWEEAKSNLQRAEKLRSQNASSQGELDQAIAAEKVSAARYASALNGVREKIAVIAVRKAELALAKQQLTDAVIRSPLDGYVQQRQVAPGTYLAVGQSIAVMIRTHPLRFRGTVPEKHAQSMAIGQAVTLKIESLDEPRQAKVTRVSPTLDQQSRGLPFEVEIDNSDYELRSGLFAEAQVVVDPGAKAIVIPHSAIIEFAGTQKVWKVVDDVAVEQEVLIGERRDLGREILQGLTAGDTIMVDAKMGRVAKIKSRTSPVEDSSADTPASDTSPPEE